MKPDLSRVKLFLLDMDGTVYLENQPLPGAVEAVERLRNQSSVCFLTNNSSVSAADYVDKLCGMGIRITSKEIYTSGQATAELLAAKYPGKTVYLVGTPKLEAELAAYGIPLTEEDPDIVVLGYDTTLTYAKLVLLTRYVAHGALFVATHSDINCPAAGVYRPDVGSMLELVAASTGRRPDIVCGKPNRPIAEGIRRRFALEGGDEIAMVGDRLSTDMRFAAENGFVSVLVLSGETDEAMLKKSGMRPDFVMKNIGALAAELDVCAGRKRFI